MALDEGICMRPTTFRAKRKEVYLNGKEDLN
jgi:hypothetical protein